MSHKINIKSIKSKVRCFFLLEKTHTLFSVLFLIPEMILCDNKSGFAFFGASTLVVALFYLEGNKMSDYKTLYHKMFNGVTDTIERLIKLQQDAEEEFLKNEEREENIRSVIKLVKKDGLKSDKD
jgi:hypothetical protein